MSQTAGSGLGGASAGWNAMVRLGYGGFTYFFSHKDFLRMTYFPNEKNKNKNKDPTPGTSTHSDGTPLQKT